MRKIAKDIGKIVLGITIAAGAMKETDKMLAETKSPAYADTTILHQIDTTTRTIGSELVGLSGGYLFMAGMIPIVARYEDKKYKNPSK